jgi:hypothetical protein
VKMGVDRVAVAMALVGTASGDDLMGMEGEGGGGQGGEGFGRVGGNGDGGGANEEGE